MIRWRTITVASLSSALLGCPSKAKVECYLDQHCNLNIGDRCFEYEVTHDRWCQRHDDTCTSGWRWYDIDDLGDGLAGLCWEPPPADAAPPPPTTWAMRLGGEGDESPEAIAVGPDSSIYVAGVFIGTTNLGGQELIGNSSAGSCRFFSACDVFVAKYTNMGQHLWSRAYNDGVIWAIAIDEHDDVIIAGHYVGGIDFGGNALSGGFLNAFIAKLSGRDGEHIWSVGFGGEPESGAARITALAMDVDNNVVVAGDFAGAVNFGGGDHVSTEMTRDLFVAKYSGREGTHIWSIRHGGAGDDTASSVAVDGADVFVAGQFDGAARFGGPVFTSRGATDIFMARFSGANGAYQWSMQHGGARADECHGIAVRDGHLIATGFFNDGASFGGDALDSSGVGDVFLAKYDAPTSSHLWSSAYGGTSTDKGNAVAFSLNGTIALAGTFIGRASFGGRVLEGANGTSGVIAGYQATTGDHVMSMQVAGIGEASARELATTRDAIVVAGHFEDQVLFEGTELTSAGQKDVYLIHYVPPPLNE